MNGYSALEHRDQPDPTVWKVTITNHFVTMVYGNTCVSLLDPDRGLVVSHVKNTFGHKFEGHYFFAHDEFIKKMYAKQLLMRDTK